MNQFEFEKGKSIVIVPTASFFCFTCFKKNKLRPK